MLVKMQALVYSVQESNGPNGERYIRVFMGQEANPDDNKTKGISLQSLSAEPSVFDNLHIKQFPALAEVELDTMRGGQNKMKLHVVGIKPMQQPKATAQA